MAICPVCDQEMMAPGGSGANSCTQEFVEYPDGSKLVPSRAHFNEPTGRCHDCNIAHGGLHHPGCDAERCPKCGGQLISCGCLDDPDERDPAVDDEPYE